MHSEKDKVKVEVMSAQHSSNAKSPALVFVHANSLTRFMLWKPAPASGTPVLKVAIMGDLAWCRALFSMRLDISSVLIFAFFYIHK